MVNAGTYKFEFDIADGCGAVWDPTSNDPISITITQKALTVPSITAEHTYNGSPQQFIMTGFNSTTMKVDSAAGANGNTVTGANGAAVTDTTSTFEAKYVDEYTATLSLRDTNNYCWNGTPNTGVKKLDFEITQKELSFTFTCSETNGSWEYGTSGVTVTATEDSVAGDSLSFVFYYDTTTTTLSGTPDTNNAKATILSIPDTVANGSHTLYAVLNGTAGDNANYKLAENKNSFNFNVTSGSIDLSKIKWDYTVDGATGGKIEDGGELPFTLKTGSTTVGVQYELSVNIPSDMSYIEVDTAKYNGGYNGDKSKSAVTTVGGTYTLTVALKSTDNTKEFDVGSGNKSATYDLTIAWKIVKGTFDLSGVKWEYYYTDSNGQKQTKDYTGAIEFDDVNYAVRIKESTLPAGLTLVPAYQYSDRQRNVDSYSASAKKSDFSWSTANFNDPDVTAATLTLSWEIKQKNLYTNFKYEKVQATKSDGTTVVSFYNKILDIDDKYKSFVKYEYIDSNGTVVSLQEIIDAVDMTSPKTYTVRAYIDPAATAAANFEVVDNGSDPTDTVTTGSNNDPVYAVIDGVMIDGIKASDCKVVYDGQPHFNQLEVVSINGVKISDFTVTYYKGATLTAEKFADGEYPVQAGEYMMEVKLGSSAQDDYILLLDVIRVTIEKKEIALPTVGNITFSGEYISLADYLGGSYAEYKDIITLSGDYLELRNVSQSGYKARLTLATPDYKWAIPTTAEPASLKLFAAKLFDSEITILDNATAELKWNITPLVVDVSEMWVKGKNGATLNLPENITKLINAETLSLLYKYYDDAGQYIETPELKGGKSFRVEAVFGGIDAESGNVLFKTADGNFGAVSDKISYTVPQSGAAAFFGSTLNFLKANWLWLVIAAVALLLLILLICLIVAAKKKKRKKEELEEQRRLEKEEREKQEREERRREEREERRVERMSQQQMPQMPQMIMPQMMPQIMPQMMQMPLQPQPQPQYAPQQQPVAAGGGTVTEAQFLQMQMQAELAALKAEQTAKELAELKSRQATEQQIAQSKLETQVANMAAHSGGEQVISNGISLDKLTELIRTEVNNALDSREKKAAAPAAPESAAAPASTQVPPDAVMTTVTTTKIDTTKKPAPTAQAQAAPVRTVVRNYVAPMPVDDGRVFDVGGFYTPADPVTDLGFDDETDKD
ncbi:MAG: hypothetical protein K2O44_03350 [Clostridia bacterium]|nr:hypothetical protein [Clostridia bacterium]